MIQHGARPGSLRLSGTGLPGGTKVELDGDDISGVLTGLSLSIGVDRLPTATLDVVLHELPTELDDVLVKVPDGTRDLLLKLGWTQPGDVVPEGSEG